MNVVAVEVSYRSIIIQIKVRPRRGPGYGRNSLTAAGDANKLSSLSISDLSQSAFKMHTQVAAGAPIFSCPQSYAYTRVTVNRATEHGGASRHGQRIARWHKEHGDQPRSPTTQSGEAASEASENGRRLPCNPITRSVRRRSADKHAYTHPHTQVGEEKSNR